MPTYDEAYTIPSPKAQLIALRTMQICAEETGVADTVDPLAGSYFVETLTNEMEARIRAEMERVERMGGIVESDQVGRHPGGGRAPGLPVRADDGLRRVPEGRGEPPRRARSAERDASDAIELYAFDPRVAEAQVARLGRLRRERDQGAVDVALARLRDGARGRDNLMPPILEAVRAYATLGEMAGALRDVWGEHKEPTAF